MLLGGNVPRFEWNFVKYNEILKECKAGFAQP